jgi:putative tricarboxylic transport membrane protein
VDVALLFVIGAIGFLMRRYGWPVGPAVIGLILGPVAEAQLRRALAISEGEVSTLWSTPFSASVLAVCALMLIVPVALRMVAHRRTPIMEETR